MNAGTSSLMFPEANYSQGIANFQNNKGALTIQTTPSSFGVNAATSDQCFLCSFYLPKRKTARRQHHRLDGEFRAKRAEDLAQIHARKERRRRRSWEVPGVSQPDRYRTGRRAAHRASGQATRPSADCSTGAANGGLSSPTAPPARCNRAPRVHPRRSRQRVSAISPSAITLRRLPIRLPRETGQWPGDIEFVAMFKDFAFSDAQISQIALGADPLVLAGAKKPFLYRKFDGTPATYSAPPTVTTDTNPAAQPWAGGSFLYPGSTFRRQSTANYILANMFSHRWVFPFDTETELSQVPFSGVGGGFTGAVEIKVYHSVTGVVVRDWTTVGSLSAGKWSGTIELPAGKDKAWWVYSYRSKTTPTIIGHCRQKFGVGLRIGFMGQSQTSTAVKYSGTEFSRGSKRDDEHCRSENRYCSKRLRPGYFLRYVNFRAHSDY